MKLFKIKTLKIKIKLSQIKLGNTATILTSNCSIVQLKISLAIMPKAYCQSLLETGEGERVSTRRGRVFSDELERGRFCLVKKISTIENGEDVADRRDNH